MQIWRGVPRYGHTKAFSLSSRRCISASTACARRRHVVVRVHEQAQQTLSELQKDLEAAVKAQEFRLAAQLKAQIESARQADPVLALKDQLEAAIKEERYEDAAKLRQQLQQAEALNPNVTTTSDMTTQGIRVQVQSFFLPAHSMPARSQWFYAYTVTITNNSSNVVQLKSRHWIITDETGNMEEVRGLGVVGNQPILLPGKSFEYQSGCPLRTPTGTMHGTYQFTLLNPQTGTFEGSFDVVIGRFKLDAEGTARI